MSCSARYAWRFVTNCVLTGNHLACLTPNLHKTTPPLALIHGFDIDKEKVISAVCHIADLYIAEALALATLLSIGL